MRKSKFLNQTFDNNWKCVHCGIEGVTGAFYKGTRARTITRGHRNYYYLFVRETSDGKFDKMIRLSHHSATQIYKGTRTVESFANRKEKFEDPAILNKIGYYFK